jgi:hypothetical protein
MLRTMLQLFTIAALLAGNARADETPTTAPSAADLAQHSGHRRHGHQRWPKELRDLVKQMKQEGRSREEIRAAIRDYLRQHGHGRKTTPNARKR